MKVEIWSDIICPYCYIGKRRFEQGLERFENSDEIDVEWKSFQLNPDMKTDPDRNIHEYLAEVKGWPLSEAKKMNEKVTEMAENAGLEYNLDQAVVANTMHAHRLIHLAKTKNRGDRAAETLFRAYFTEGRNIADHDILIGLAADIGLDPEEVREVLETGSYKEQVQADIREAKQLEISGVPFFLFNRKYAVSGAQPADTFAEALQTSWKEWKRVTE